MPPRCIQKMALAVSIFQKVLPYGWGRKVLDHRQRGPDFLHVKSQCYLQNCRFLTLDTLFLAVFWLKNAITLYKQENQIENKLKFFKRFLSDIETQLEVNNKIFFFFILVDFSLLFCKILTKTKNWDSNQPGGEGWE